MRINIETSFIEILEHAFYQKWGSIISNESDNHFSNLISPKGYLKCSIVAQTKGDKMPVNLINILYSFVEIKMTFFCIINYKLTNEEDSDENEGMYEDMLEW